MTLYWKVLVVCSIYSSAVLPRQSSIDDLWGLHLQPALRYLLPPTVVTVLLSSQHPYRNFPCYECTMLWITGIPLKIFLGRIKDFTQVRHLLFLIQSMAWRLLLSSQNSVSLKELHFSMLISCDTAAVLHSTVMGHLLVHCPPPPTSPWAIQPRIHPKRPREQLYSVRHLGAFSAPESKTHLVDHSSQFRVPWMFRSTWNCLKLLLWSGRHEPPSIPKVLPAIHQSHTAWWCRACAARCLWAREEWTCTFQFPSTSSRAHKAMRLAKCLSVPSSWLLLSRGPCIWLGHHLRWDSL